VGKSRTSVFDHKKPGNADCYKKYENAIKKGLLYMRRGGETSWGGGTWRGSERSVRKGPPVEKVKNFEMSKTEGEEKDEKDVFLHTGKIWDYLPDSRAAVFKRKRGLYGVINFQNIYRASWGGVNLSTPRRGNIKTCPGD